MSDVLRNIFIVDYGLQSCLGNNIADALNTLKHGAVKPCLVDIPEGQRRPYYLMGATTVGGVQNLNASAWQERTLQAVQSVCEGYAVNGQAIYIASSSLDIGGIRVAAHLGAPQFYFGKQLAEAFNWPSQPITVDTACTSAFNAVGMAVNQFKTGHQSEALVLGVEMFNEYTLFGFEAMQLLTSTAAQPLGQDRQGLVLGEAVAALHLTNKLTTLSVAQQNKAWRVMSCINVVDGRNPTGATEGALIQACHQALAEAGLSTRDIDLIKLQAAGSPSNDSVEIAALHQVFKALPPCISLKMALGHTLGASGAAETALLLACLENQVWPYVDYSIDSAFDIAFDDALDVHLVSSHHPIDGTKVKTIFLITLGFGGGHSVLILKKNAP